MYIRHGLKHDVVTEYSLICCDYESLAVKYGQMIILLFIVRQQVAWKMFFFFLICGEFVRLCFVFLSKADFNW